MDKTIVVMAAGLGSRYGGVKQIERLGPDGEILMEYAINRKLKVQVSPISPAPAAKTEEAAEPAAAESAAEE